MSDEIRDAIKDNATGPKRVQGDELTVEQHSIKDQIEADRYTASNDATKTKGLGIRMRRIVPPGTT